MADPSIKVIPTSYEQVVALLHSEALRAVEQAIAAAVGSRIVEDYSPACTASTLADLSVSGLTVAEVETLLVAERDRIIQFGVAFLQDRAATADEEQFPPGEELDPDGPGEVQGLGAGFGVMYAIYYNFLARRTPAEFRAHLQNRRIPHPARFARELRRVYEALRPQSE